MNKRTRRVEIHSHMFNGNYIPIEEYLYSLLFKRNAFYRPIAVVLGKILKLCISKKIERFKDIESTLEVLESIDNDDVVFLAELITEIFTEDLIENVKNLDNRLLFVSDLKSTPLVNSVVDLIFTDADLVDQPEAYSAADEFYENIITCRVGITKDKNKEIAEIAEKQMFEKLIEILVKYLTKLAGKIKFVVIMLISDHDLYLQLLDKNYDKENKPDLTVHLTMDIEAAYRSIMMDALVISPEFKFYTRQINESARFIRESNGRLLGFVAYHPERGYKGYKRCMSAIKNGHVGIKIYPPLNHRPDGRPMKKISGKRERVKNYRKELKRLYKECQLSQIPILTHCTPVGFQPWSDTGALSNPDYWENVLNDYPKLRLCFGHAGGGYYKYNDYYSTDIGEEGKITFGWYSKEWESESEEKSNYAKKIVRLCNDFENVYTDISYLYEALFADGNVDDGVVDGDQLFVNLRNEITNGKKFHKKVMYGSDWHMSNMIGNANDYMNVFDNFFSKTENEKYKDDFFYNNAIRFLNLKQYLESGNAAGAFDSIGLNYLRSLVNNYSEI